MIKADNNTEVLHQLAAIAEFLEKHGYAKIAKKIQKSLKKDFGDIPPQKDGEWKWVNSSSIAACSNSSGDGDKSRMKRRSRRKNKKQDTTSSKKGSCSDTKNKKSNEEKRAAKRSNGQEYVSETESDETADINEGEERYRHIENPASTRTKRKGGTEANEIIGNDSDNDTGEEECDANNGERNYRNEKRKTLREAPRMVYFSDDVQTLLLSPRNASEKKAMYYNKSEIRRFKTENITEKAHESQDLLNVLMASASATMTCSI